MLYLAQKYSGMEEKAIEIAHEMVNTMEKLGHDVFSPILYTHYHAKWLNEKRVLYIAQKVWEISDDEVLTIYPEVDWVEQDLRKCSRWLNHDYCSNGNNFESLCSCRNDKNDKKCEIKYDTGLIMLFREDCFENQIPNIKTDDVGPFKFVNPIWASKGAEKKYIWAQKHHVRCLIYEAFIKEIEVEL